MADDAPTNEQGDAKVPTVKGTIFVSGLKADTTRDDFLTYFSKFGEVKKVKIKVDKSMGESRGFGLVRFSDKRTLQSGVLEACHFLGGRRLNVRPAIPLKKLTEYSLYEYFSQFGIVTDVGVSMADKFDGRGFVDFRDMNSARKVLESQPHKFNENKITATLTKQPGSEDSG
ncbi:unnamed protein product [Dibothriocephalus latus]|uniref:RRM domain-containing protein n=1 Tax=Dibothriocephalus latus TaxID=60516 RepID=A0A3P7LWE6_DIBLA|nr:unnamed protein product [Dibothriocephalus latus]